jgi:hypothetical protein
MLRALDADPTTKGGRLGEDDDGERLRVGLCRFEAGDVRGVLPLELTDSVNAGSISRVVPRGLYVALRGDSSTTTSGPGSARAGKRCIMRLSSAVD